MRQKSFDESFEQINPPLAETDTETPPLSATQPAAPLVAASSITQEEETIEIVSAKETVSDNTAIETTTTVTTTTTTIDNIKPLCSIETDPKRRQSSIKSVKLTSEQQKGHSANLKVNNLIANDFQLPGHEIMAMENNVELDDCAAHTNIENRGRRTTDPGSSSISKSKSPVNRKKLTTRQSTIQRFLKLKI